MSDLSYNIVIKSRYGANAGATPRNYILDYAARDNATEAFRPFTAATVEACMKQYNDFVVACDVLEVDEGVDPKDVEDKLVPISSRIFGSKGVRYDEETLQSELDRLDKALDDGHTLVSPVFSFTFDYLNEKNVFPIGFTKPVSNEDRGKYIGSVDHLKMRYAINTGMESLCQSMGLVDPLWLGTIQMDTLNVHSHIIFIDTADFDKIPESRFVYSPKKETVYKDDPDGGDKKIAIQKEVYDENGALVKEFLGERGKMSESDMMSFRKACDFEFDLLKQMKPFTANMTPQRDIVKDKSVSYHFENKKSLFLMSNIYHFLPKALPEELTELDEDASDEEKLLEAQEHWLSGSNALFMKEANDASFEFVDYLFEHQLQNLGLTDFEKNLNRYVKHKHPESRLKQSLEKEKEEKRIKQMMVQHLYESFKPIRLYDDSLESEIMIQMENEQLLEEDISVSSAPFSRVSGKQYIKGNEMSDSAYFKLLSDDILKDLIAHSFEDPSLNPGFEWRVRSYTDRFDMSKKESDSYNDLLEDFDWLDKRRNISKAAYAMRDLYAFEADYHQGLADKYGYLSVQEPSITYDYEGVAIPIPYTKGVKDISEVDWAYYGDTFHLVYDGLGSQVSFSKNDVVHLDVEFMDPKFINAFLEFSGRESILEMKPEFLNQGQAVAFDAFINVYDYTEKVIDFSNSVSKERFNDVKHLDIINQIYDLPPDDSRLVDPRLWDKYKDTVSNRKNVYENALLFLEDTNQSGTSAYLQYKGTYDKINEELEFIDYVDSSQELVKDGFSIDSKIVLPKPQAFYSMDEIDLSNKPLLFDESQANELFRTFLNSSKQELSKLSHQLVESLTDEIQYQAFEDHLEVYHKDYSKYNDVKREGRSKLANEKRSRDIARRLSVEKQSKYLEKNEVMFSF